MKTVEIMLSRYFKVSKYLFEMDEDYVQMKQIFEKQEEDIKKELTGEQLSMLLGLENCRDCLAAEEVENAFLCGFYLGAQTASELDAYRVKLEEAENRLEYSLHCRSTGGYHTDCI